MRKDIGADTRYEFRDEKRLKADAGCECRDVKGFEKADERFERTQERMRDEKRKKSG